MGTFEEYMSPEEWKIWKTPPKKEDYDDEVVL
jgi:hypothetical protein